MALIQSSGVTSASSGGCSYDWAYQSFEITVSATPPVTYVSLPLNFEPVGVYSAMVWSEGQFLHPDEYVIEDMGAGPTIRLLFPIDPTMGANGTSWFVSIQYPYIP